MPAGPRNPALDGPYLTITHLGGFFVAEPAAAHQHQDLPVGLVQLPERAMEIAKFERGILGCRNGRNRFEAIARAAHVDESCCLQGFVVVEVSQNRKGPSLEVRSGLELVGRGQYPYGGVLHEIFGTVGISRQVPGEGAHLR